MQYIRPNNYIEKENSSEKKHNNILKLLTVLAIVAVIIALTQVGIAWQKKTRVLTCPVTDIVAHTHNNDCYLDGELVCTLPELPEHTHTDECYDLEGNLICGEEETAYTHVHNENCFTIITENEEEEQPDETIVEPEPTDQVFTQELKDTNDNIILIVEAIASAGALPDNSTMKAEWVNNLSTQQMNAVENAVSENTDGVIIDVQAVDITFYNEEGEPIEPSETITVTFTSPTLETGDQHSVVHIDDLDEETQENVNQGNEEPERTAQVIDSVNSEANGQIVIENDQFSVYVVTTSTVDQSMNATDGETYDISVNAPAAAGIPSGSELSVVEITPDNEAYETYKTLVQEAISNPNVEVKLFDISIQKNKREIQPQSDTNVNVNIWLNTDTTDSTVIHFHESEPEIIETSQVDNIINFETNSFSVYAIVSAPEPAEPLVPTTSQSLTDIETAANNGQTFYLYEQRGNRAEYLGDTLTSSKCINITTAQAQAGAWILEPTGTQNHYYIKLDDDHYIQQENDNSNNILLTSTPTEFEFIPNITKTEQFYIRVVGQERYLQYSNSGKGIRLWTDNANMQNSSWTAIILPKEEAEIDTYGLDNQSFGISYHNDTTMAGAMLAQEATSGNLNILEAQRMTIRPDVLNNEGVLLIAQNADISFWTLHAQDDNTYTLSVAIDNQEKYLAIDGTNLSLTDNPDNAAHLNLVPGANSNQGKWQLYQGNKALGLKYNSAGNIIGFSMLSQNDTTTWLTFLRQSELTDEDFQVYTARKVNVSDTEKVKHGTEVILYTRQWNETTKKYEYYIIDYNGNLIRAWDNDDEINWTGNTVNTALWKFIEYTDNEGNSNGYYELENTQYHNYLVPQFSNHSILSDTPVGINLPGRQYGSMYSTIIAWDDPTYAYTGLHIENGVVTPDSLNAATDIYFAIIEPTQEDEVAPLTTVNTLDNNDYGIVMKMIDFNNPKINNRDSIQHPFFNNQNDVMGLVTTNLVDGQYPYTTALCGHEDSLQDLFNDMTTVNHLFINSVHEESGYFTYDSTQNFAHLNANNTFTVYDQLGSMRNYERPTGTHGQFMPYNDLTPGVFTPFTNQTNVLGQPLDDLDPRKGEKIYDIGSTENVDYHFGMEMSASFTQTPDGLDDWGHDIIFEFSGDDDFWLYVDGELILDLGGVHSAMVGNVNFRTGQITSSRVNTTLYQQFKSNYLTRGYTEAEAQAMLDDIFTQNEDGQYIFKDYTKHDMRLFYMERGSGASNLKLKFNLSTVRKGSFILSKKLSGTEMTSTSLIECPYQIEYRTTADGGTIWHPLGANAGENNNVVYEGTNNPVKYKASTTIALKEYQHVFYLTPGQSAEVKLPEGTLEYRVTECAVNSHMFDNVSANGVNLTPTLAIANRNDYTTAPANSDDQSTLTFDNHVKDGAITTINITKILYDVNGQTRLNSSNAKFNFRLYLESEHSDTLRGANMHPYHVKDNNENYCTWNAEQQTFVSTNVTDFSTFTEAQKEAATFFTSMNGAISKIPINHTIEVIDIPIGTRYKIEERENEIPAGYTLRLADGYTRLDTTPVQEQEDPIIDVITENEKPEVEIRNQKGWGLTINKVWTDDAFMTSHDPVYFAVYIRKNDNLTLVPNTVRCMDNSNRSIYYFFDTLKEAEFADYLPYEVKLTGSNIEVTDDVVTGYDTIEPLNNNDTIEISGTPIIENQTLGNDIVYTVTYERGEQTQANENVRTDTITNSRPGIKIMKTDWDNNPLANATFTLTNANGDDVASTSYTSGQDGIITTAYLPIGTYKLTEIRAPKGYGVALEQVTINVSENGVTISPQSDACSVHTNDNMLATIKIKNNKTSLTIRKTDKNGEPLADAHFAIYRQVIDTSGNPRKEYHPMTGYEDLVSATDGTLPKIADLSPNTYYLTETEAPEGYDPIVGDICFTISKNGTVKINSAEHVSWLTSNTTNNSANIKYTITIPNHQNKHIKMKKVSIASPTTSALEGARFSLYKVINGNRVNPPLFSNITSGANGMLSINNSDIFNLPSGEYQLIETTAPDGYRLPEYPVSIVISDNTTGHEIYYNDHSIISQSPEGCTYDAETGTYLLLITNNNGAVLPATGSHGYAIFYVIGITMIATTIALFTKKKIAI